MDERRLQFWLNLGSIVLLAALVFDFAYVIVTALGVG
jgi:hypothetical protein